jgi:MFS superfamily sulfate permease-like transporter
LFNFSSIFVKVGIVNFLQGLAYSLLADVPAINGVYSTVFNVLTYIFFGTSRHFPNGTYAIVSLMVLAPIQRYEGIWYPSEGSSNSTTENNSSFISNNPEEAKIIIATSISLIVGIIQLLFSILHFGFITKYLSNSIVDGFTAASAIHIALSQLPYIFGVKLKSNPLPFKIIGILIEFFSTIKETNLATLTIGLISLAILFIFKEFINAYLMKRYKQRIPIEIIFVIVFININLKKLQFFYLIKLKTIVYYYYVGIILCWFLQKMGR